MFQLKSISQVLEEFKIVSRLKMKVFQILLKKLLKSNNMNATLMMQ